MYKNEYDQMMRLLVVGSSSVGKTCLLKRFSEGNFQEIFIPTVGIDFAVKNMKIENKTIKVQIFDTAGQERFKSIISSYFRNADGILIVYDVTDKQSFDDIEEVWLRDIKLNSREGIKLILVGNKADMDTKRQVSFDMGLKLSQKLNIVFIETSAKTEQNVNEAFEAITKDIYYKNKIEGEPSSYQQQNTNNLKKQPNSNKSLEENSQCSC